MNTTPLRILAICGWAGPATLVVAFLGWLIAGVLPFPLGPSSSTAEVVDFYTSGTRVPMGLALASIGVSLAIGLIAGISHLMRQVPGQELLAQIQTVAGTTTCVLLLVPMLIMATAGFRPDRDPELTVMLNDLSWLLFLTPIAPFIIQNLVVATSILTAEEPWLPRGLGYLNLWVGFTFSFDILAFAFHRGPFAWNGFLIFWLALTTYSVWLLAMGLGVRWHAMRVAEPDDDIGTPLPVEASA